MQLGPYDAVFQHPEGTLAPRPSPTAPLAWPTAGTERSQGGSPKLRCSPKTPTRRGTLGTVGVSGFHQHTVSLVGG